MLVCSLSIWGGVFKRNGQKPNRTKVDFISEVVNNLKPKKPELFRSYGIMNITYYNGTLDHTCIWFINGLRTLVNTITLLWPSVYVCVCRTVLKCTL